MKCSFTMAVASPARCGLQLIEGWLSVLVATAYRLASIAASETAAGTATRRGSHAGAALSPRCSIRCVIGWRGRWLNSALGQLFGRRLRDGIRAS